MLYDSASMERAAALRAAESICAAARTAPKTKGIDRIECCALTGEDLEKLAAEMERLAPILNYDFFLRDADNLRHAQAVVLIGAREMRRGLQDGCGYCHFQNCADCAEKNGLCAFDSMDLGIAIGSAVSVAADLRIDNRVMFSVGRAAAELKLLGEDVRMIIGLPLCISGKSPFFDRKKKN